MARYKPYELNQTMIPLSYADQVVLIQRVALRCSPHSTGLAR
jgi:hypothetical protein